MIPFNKPFLSGNEIRYISEAVDNGKISGDGIFTRKCQDFLQSRYAYGKTLLTTSCTDALEMVAEVKRKIRQSEKIPNFLLEGLKNSLQDTELTEELNTAIEEVNN